MARRALEPSQSLLERVFHYNLKDPSWEPTEADSVKSKTSINTGGGGNGDSLPPDYPYAYGVCGTPWSNA